MRGQVVRVMTFCSELAESSSLGPAGAPRNQEQLARGASGDSPPSLLAVSTCSVSNARKMRLSFRWAKELRGARRGSGSIRPLVEGCSLNDETLRQEQRGEKIRVRENAGTA